MRMRHVTTDSADAPNAGGPALPDWNTSQYSQYSQKYPIWLWPAAALAVCAVCGAVIALAWPAGAALAAAFVAMTEEYAEALRALFFGLIVLGAVGVARVLFNIGAWARNKAERAGIVEAPAGALHVLDMRRSDWRAASVRAVDLHYETQQTWAEHSAFRALTTYGPSVSSSYRNDVQGAPAAPEAAPLALPDLEIGSWRTLARDGAILLGIAVDGAHYADLDYCAGIGIAGAPRSGKTTLASLILAQAARQDAAIILCDPHRAHPESLAARCAALSGAFIRQATAPEEIAEAIRFAMRIAQRRLSHPEEARERVILAIDEFTSLVLRRLLEPAILDALTALIIEPAKAKVHTVLIGHDWSSRTLGSAYGAPLRRAITHRAVLRCAADNASFLLPSAALARQAEALKRGEAILFGDEGPVTARIPQISAADLTWAARRPPRALLSSQYSQYSQKAPEATPVIPPTLRAAPATEALPALTIDDQILGLLAARGGWLAGKEIASAIPGDPKSIYNALAGLSKAGAIRQRGRRGSYEYIHS